MKIESMEQIQALIELAMQNKLELLEVDNIKIVRTRHEYPQPSTNNPVRTLEEELFGPQDFSS